MNKKYDDVKRTYNHYHNNIDNNFQQNIQTG